MQLFETLDDLKPFIFRITDNGGESADRYTVITCDGDYYGMSGAPFHPQGVGMSGEGIDVQGVADRVEAGVERDLRWIDLPEACQRCVMGGLNEGFRDYLESAPAAGSRDAALDFQGWSDWQWRSRENTYSKSGATEVIYRDGVKFKVRRDDLNPLYSDDGDPEFDSFREALLYCLPDDYDCSGPEYQTQIDMWDTEGGPVTPWNRDLDPPMIDANLELARVELVGPDGATIGHFATGGDAANYVAKLERDFYHAAPVGGDDEFDRAAYVIRNPNGW